MRRLKRILLIALVVGATLVLSLAAWLMLQPVPPVTVIVKNASGKVIASVRVEHERGVEILESLAPGEANAMRFEVGGETSYQLRVRFADGSELAGGGGYAEPGYKFSETITDSTIETETRLPTRY